MSNIETNVERPSPDEVLTHAYYEYSDAGLRTPPIPRELIPSLENFSPWCYGTRDVSPADRTALVTEASDAEAQDYLVWGHVGYGVNNWSVAARLLLGPLAVFVRHPWGGAMGDRDVDSVAVHRSFSDLEELIVAAENARKSGRLAPNERVLVIQDDLQGGGWQVVGRAGSRWVGSRDAIRAALAGLRA